MFKNRYTEDAAQQALTFFRNQSFRVNSRVYETTYPDWDFTSLIYVETSGPEWAPGVLTYMTDMTGRANWQSGAAKDVPLADVSQDSMVKTHHMGSIGYQYNIEEINAVVQMGGTLSDRKARAARLAYQKFMFDLTLFGDAEKGMGGITNFPGVPISVVPNDGTGSVRWWVDSNGVGTKSPDLIVRDINIALQGVARTTFDQVLANTLFMPQAALDYIASTPYSAMTMETILSFVQRTNLYTMRTGQPLSIRSFRELETAATNTDSPSSAGNGRLVAYNNAPEYLQLHLPMPHRFLPVYQDGPMNYVVPGIFRTGGVEVMSSMAITYVDGVSEAPA